MRQRLTPPFQHWLTTVLFASDFCAIPHIHGLLRATCYRHYHQMQHGIPTNLATMLTQEQGALRFGNIVPTLSPADLAYTDYIISPYLAATDYPPRLPCCGVTKSHATSASRNCDFQTQQDSWACATLLAL